MSRSKIVFIGFLTVGCVVIATSVVMCPNPQMWRRFFQPSSWLHMLSSVGTPVGLALVCAWLARVGFILGRAEHMIRRLPRTDLLPAPLIASIARTGVRRVRCIAARSPIAFCAGAMRPVIVVSEGLADRLDDDELDAVLLHEHRHLREYEPAIRAAAEVAADVLFFIPIARWLARRRTEEAELRADRAAMQELGPRPVAAALCALGSAQSADAAAFAGVAELRVAQLLGDPIHVPRPGAGLVAASLIGFPFALIVASCFCMSVTRILAS